ncbi:alpha/beta fold hydrolase [Streptomyces sp. NPDC059894]|uniref:alpha/beta fold hydrolase n=1 Tax=unclassified Streptomyces TaxID=2593676 RepID=UPI00364F693B
MTTTLHLSDEAAGITVRFEHGTVVEIQPGGRPDDATIELHGTRAQWKQALQHAVDLGEATNPAIGGLRLRGDFVHRAGNAVALQRLWTAMRRSAGAAPGAAPPKRPSPLSAEVTGCYVEVAGILTYYESAGTGRPVLCLHSGGADSREYRHLLPFLASIGFCGIALDMPGHGKSYPDLETLAPLDSADAWIDFLAAFSDVLGLDRPVLVGCAMSGSLILRFAALRPDAVSAVVSTNGNADYKDALGADFLDVMNHPQVNVADYLEAGSFSLLGRRLPTANLNECLWHNARNLTPEVMHADLAIYNEHDITALLDRITAPVLHLHGASDPSVNEANAAAIRKGIRDLVMVELPGVGHIPMLEDPERFNSEVGHFLRSVFPSDGPGGAESGPASRTLT